MSSVTDHLNLLSDPTRVRILRLLEREELTVGEISRVLQLPQSTVSRHLKALHAVGWTARRAEGTATVVSFLLASEEGTIGTLWALVRRAAEHQAAIEEDAARLTSILEQRRTDSRSWFGQVAGRWSEVRRELFGELFALPTLLSLLDDDLVVADLGCGTGEFSELLAPAVGSVIAVDQDDRMLKVARQRLEGFENVELLEGALDDLPVADSSLDAALAMLVLHFVERPETALGEIRRALKSNGRLVVLDMQAHTRERYRRKMGHVHLGFSRAQFEADANAAGLVLKSYRKLPADPAAQGPPLFVAVLQRQK